MIGQLAASMKWRLHQGDVDSAFLNGRSIERDLYVRAPKGGLPATENHPAIEEGTVMQITKSVYGLNDAPFEWNAEHVQGMIDVGFIQSQVHPTVFLYWKDDDTLQGMLGMHVDDDLMTGSDWFEEKVIPELK